MLKKLTSLVIVLMIANILFAQDTTQKFLDTSQKIQDTSQKRMELLNLKCGTPYLQKDQQVKLFIGGIIFIVISLLIMYFRKNKKNV
jgi:preprotein translocase subunit SecG